MKSALRKFPVVLTEKIGKPFDGFDKNIVKFTRKQENPVLRPLMVWISNMGEPWTLYPVSGVVAAQWMSRERRADAIALGTALGGSAILNKVIKGKVKRPRPMFRVHLTKSSGSSFPSSHMTMTLATYGSMAYLMARKRGQMLDSYAISKQWGPMALICALIGYSRVYQGLHHPSDVLGSVGIGTIWLTICGVIRHFIGSGMGLQPSATQDSEAGKDA